MSWSHFRRLLASNGTLSALWPVLQQPGNHHVKAIIQQAKILDYIYKRAQGERDARGRCLIVVYIKSRHGHEADMCPETCTSATVQTGVSAPGGRVLRGRPRVGVVAAAAAGALARRGPATHCAVCERCTAGRTARERPASCKASGQLALNTVNVARSKSFVRGANFAPSKTAAAAFVCVFMPASKSILFNCPNLAPSRPLPA